MTQKTVLLLSIFFFSSCHPQIKENICPVSADEVLSCIASSEHLSTQEVTSKFESLTNPTNPEPNTAKLNKLLCLALHSRSSKEQLQKGESLLTEILNKTECRKQNLSGLLHIIQGNIYLHKQYLDKNWNLFLKKKKISKKQEAVKLQHDNEIISYQRRIQDLEQQVQKLKEIESMLDKNVRP
jgi:hypothetical protein